MAAFMGQPSLVDNSPSYSFPQQPTSAPDGLREHRFYPYTDNGGSTLGISGSDFTILAGDTRSTTGYNINTRYAPKLFLIGAEDSSTTDEPLTAKTPRHHKAHIVLSVVGYAADGNALKERLDAVVKMYRYQHGKRMSVKACAQRLSTILYSKRFFPYYVHAILGGLDEDGTGALYSYDPVGSYEREQCRAAGAASSLITPFLDNQVNFKNQYIPGSGEGHALKQREVVPLQRTEVEQLVRDAFTSAVERHIEVGDGLQMMVVTKDGIEEIYSPLKKD
ncbi:MAG: Proteasome subunit beta type-6 [Piccolia ochrophora]|nr:MAG: Proteasome subunit beta type-6 [Piccolia ochrophora]